MSGSTVQSLTGLDHEPQQEHGRRCPYRAGAAPRPESTRALNIPPPQAVPGPWRCPLSPVISSGLVSPFSGGSIWGNRDVTGGRNVRIFEFMRLQQDGGKRAIQQYACMRANEIARPRAEPGQQCNSSSPAYPTAGHGAASTEQVYLKAT